MKPITCLVVATVAVALAIPAHAQVDCADWKTQDFFEAAVVSDVVRCLEAGADLEARTGKSGSTPLHHAALSGAAEVVAVLLKAGADVEARTTREGWTPLYGAAVSGAAEIVTALLEAGADPKARANKDKLPFDWAENNGLLKGTDAYWKLNEARFK